MIIDSHKPLEAARSGSIEMEARRATTTITCRTGVGYHNGLYMTRFPRQPLDRYLRVPPRSYLDERPPTAMALQFYLAIGSWTSSLSLDSHQTRLSARERQVRIAFQLGRRSLSLVMLQHQCHPPTKSYDASATCTANFPLATHEFCVTSLKRSQSSAYHLDLT